VVSELLQDQADAEGGLTVEEDLWRGGALVVGDEIQHRPHARRLLVQVEIQMHLQQRSEGTVSAASPRRCMSQLMLEADVVSVCV